MRRKKLGFESLDSRTMLTSLFGESVETTVPLEDEFIFTIRDNGAPAAAEDGPT